LPPAATAGAKNNENHDDTPNDTGLVTHNGQLNQFVRAELATSENNETGIADQRKLHGPEGAKTTANGLVGAVA
jgi:hypothetical protein